MRSCRMLPEGLALPMEMILMKTTLLAICILGASAAFGQAATNVLSARPQIYTFETHPEHASRQPLAMEQNLNGNEVLVYAQGERPLWEVATPVHEVPLGDSARALRQEHETATRAARHWQNQ
jgi:hypothetical protein